MLTALFTEDMTQKDKPQLKKSTLTQRDGVSEIELCSYSGTALVVLITSIFPGPPGARIWRTKLRIVVWRNYWSPWGKKKWQEKTRQECEAGTSFLSTGVTSAAWQTWRAALLTVKRATAELPKKECTLLKCYSWRRIKKNEKEKKMNDMLDLSLCFKEAYLQLQVPTVQGKLLLAT